MRFRNPLRSISSTGETRNGMWDNFDEFVTMYANGQQYVLNTSMGITSRETIPSGYEQLTEMIYKRNGVVFACVAARSLLFSEARFQFRRMNQGRPGDLFGTDALRVLEQPWPNGTTGELLTRMEQDVSLAGNFYGVIRNRGTRQARIRRLRPDWVTIVIGVDGVEGDPNSPDAEVIGYFYQPWVGIGGKTAGNPEFFPVDEVAHYSPTPDPSANFRGMSWLTPVLREVASDSAATSQKLKYFENNSTVNLAIKFDPSVSEDGVRRFKALMEEGHTGVANAYKNLFLGGGADVTPIGTNLKDMDFKAVQGAGETRVAAAAQVPPIVVGLSEGLEASTYCLPADGLVWTTTGPKRIVDVQSGDVVWSYDGGRLSPSKVAWQSQTGTKPVYTVKTRNRTIRATGNHPFLVRVPGTATRLGQRAVSAGLAWRNLEDLRPGDCVVQPMRLPNQGLRCLPNGSPATIEVMQWLGAYTGDGCLNGTSGIRMCLPKQDRVRDFYASIPPRLFTKTRNGQSVAPGRLAKDGLTGEMVRLRADGMTYRQIRDAMGLDLHPMSIRDRVKIATRFYVGERVPVVTSECRNAFQFHSRDAIAWHHEMGVTGGATTKRVPGWVFELDEDLRLAFLAGLVDTDGSIDKRGALAIGQANRPLVEDLRMLMISCGIQVSNIDMQIFKPSVLPNPGKQEQYYSYRFVASSAVDVARIPFADPLYRARVNANQKRHQPAGKDAAKMGLDGLGFFTIRRIEVGPAEPVYDIEVEDGHSFVADGIVVHNSNYGQARRKFADGWARPHWRMAAASLATIIDVPGGAQLWFDDRDISFLQEDQKDAATIFQTRAMALKSLLDAGFHPDAAIAAVDAGDPQLLVGQHSGLFSVQLQPPGTVMSATGDKTQPDANKNGDGTPPSDTNPDSGPDAPASQNN